MHTSDLRRYTRPALAAGLLVVALAAGACTGQLGRDAKAPIPANGGAAPVAAAPLPATIDPATQAPPTSAPVAKETPKDTPRGTPDRPARPVLADGRYPALLRGVDPDRGEIAVDVVQVFHGQAARDAAKADGERDAQYYENWIRNQSGRVRILRMATEGRITGPFPSEYCGIDERRASLRRLADELRRRPELGQSPYVFWTTVRDGRVQVLDVELVMLRPAC